MNKTKKLRRPPGPFCPECLCNKTKTRLRYLRVLTETWGCVTTKHEIFRCRAGCGKFVSTNGDEPELAADWV